MATNSALPEGRRTTTLGSFVRGCLEAAGLGAEDALTVARAMLEADVMGIHRYGMAWLPDIVGRLLAGGSNPSPHVEIVRRFGIVTVLDADDALGVVAMRHAVGVALDAVRPSGFSCVAIRRSGEIGAAGRYVGEIAQRGLVGMLMASGPRRLLPFGGLSPEVGDAAWAIAAPDVERPVVMDIGFAEDAGEVRPSAPFAAHKGYGLALVAGVMAGVLSGERDSASDVSDDMPEGLGQLLIVLDPQQFRAQQEYDQSMADLKGALRGSRLMAGAKRISLPGEIEEEAEGNEDLPAPSPDLLERLAALGHEYGVTFPAFEVET